VPAKNALTKFKTAPAIFDPYSTVCWTPRITQWGCKIILFAALEKKAPILIDAPSWKK